MCDGKLYVGFVLVLYPMVKKLVKGELNLDKKWQSGDLFYVIMNEIHPCFNQF